MKQKHFLFLTAIVLILSLGTIGIVAVSRDNALDIVHPDRELNDKNPTSVGLDIWDELILETVDGVKIHGWFIPPPADNNQGVLIYVHGLDGHRSQYLTDAAMLNVHGYGTFLIDLRGHGDSGGELTTLGYSEVEDVRTAVAYLLTRPEVSPDRLGIIGHSMGAATALRSIARIPELSLVIAQSSFSSIEKNIEQGVERLTGLPAFPFAPLIIWFGEQETGVDISSVAPIDDLDEIAPRPILFIHGDADNLIDVSNSQEMFAVATEPKQLLILPGVGHEHQFEVAPIEFEEAVIQFLKREWGSSAIIP